MMVANVLPIALAAVLLPVMVYRRVRRNIGRQLLDTRRLKIRSAVMALILAIIAVPQLASGRLDALAALLAGGLAGLALSVFALRHTRFEQAEGKDYYVPNPWIGTALSALLLARLGYRLWQMYPLLSQPGAAPPPALSAMTPLTLALIGAILLYNGAYTLGILRHPANVPR